MEKEKYECLLCHKKFAMLGMHIRHSHKEYTLSDYYDKYVGLETEHICALEECSNVVTLKNFTYGYHKYCCLSHTRIHHSKEEKYKLINLANLSQGWSMFKSMLPETYLKFKANADYHSFASRYSSGIFYVIEKEETIKIGISHISNPDNKSQMIYKKMGYFGNKTSRYWVYYSPDLTIAKVEEYIKTHFAPIIGTNEWFPKKDLSAILAYAETHLELIKTSSILLTA